MASRDDFAIRAKERGRVDAGRALAASVRMMNAPTKNEESLELSLSLTHTFHFFSLEKTNEYLSMPFEKNREANSLAELSRRLRKQQQQQAEGSDGAAGGVSDDLAKTERLAARKRPSPPPIRTRPLPPPPVFSVEQPAEKPPHAQKNSSAVKTSTATKKRAKPEEKEPVRAAEEDAAVAAAAAAAKAQVARRTDSYAAAFSRDLESCAALAAPVSVLGQAIGVLVGGGFSGRVWDDV